MAESKILSPSFFARDSHKVARELLGQKLCRRVGRKIFRYTITEVEVYEGPEDRASHAFGMDEPKGRSAIMFGPAGFWYVYLCYGIHWMLNVVTREDGYPAAILIRGCREVSGPGRVTKALQIDKRLNGTPASRESGLWVERSERIPKKIIRATPRIGVDYAGVDWAARPYRYLLEETKHDLSLR